MSDNITRLAEVATPVQHDIVSGLRNLADRLEKEGPAAYDMPAVSTVCVLIGHSATRLIADGELEQSCWWELFSWGPRTDAFAVRGLMATVLKG